MRLRLKQPECSAEGSAGPRFGLCGAPAPRTFPRRDPSRAASSGCPRRACVDGRLAAVGEEPQEASLHVEMLPSFGKARERFS